ncbi:hypothetical protein Patl1_30219 [Pistacia atlantica]|uniref:Uncharacterized protein n=1 Tax=Pistacia atlantica TaxID=434234 RepID=A0ACC1AC51_9ROSI|nr:hypothetical protein Patl1_30219 [Pistacia atlantica]
MSVDDFRAQDGCNGVQLKDEYVTPAATEIDGCQEGRASSRMAILNRPLVLNALNTNMGEKLNKLYKLWEDDTDIGFVMMKGSGRAFCAGGDIVALYHLINQESWHHVVG